MINVVIVKQHVTSGQRDCRRAMLGEDIVGECSGRKGIQDRPGDSRGDDQSRGGGGGARGAAEAGRPGGVPGT